MPAIQEKRWRRGKKLKSAVDPADRSKALRAVSSARARATGWRRRHREALRPGGSQAARLQAPVIGCAQSQGRDVECRKRVSSYSHQLWLRDLPACSVKILPSVPLFDDSFQILKPYDTILHRVFNNRTDQTRGNVVRT